MSHKILFTDAAKEDLREIAFHIAEISKDKELSKRFVRELRDNCKILETFPEGGALPRDRILKSAGYRFLAYKDYLTFYMVDKENNLVHIMAIFNGKKDYMRVMRKYL